MSNLAYCIAEIGSNWKKGSKPLDTAHKQIKQAQRSGADAVKFQYLSYKELYGRPNPDSPLNPYSMSEGTLAAFSYWANQLDIEFLCTAFSKEGYNYVNSFVAFHKVSSCEATDIKLMDHVMDFGKPVMISTGGLTEDQIKKLCVRYNDKIVIADCVISYPARPDWYNLTILQKALDWGCREVALSDHTFGVTTALAAQGLGATIFEKHCDFVDDDETTPDSPVSSDFDQFREYVHILKTHDRKKIISDTEQRWVDTCQRRQLEHGFYRPEPV